MRRRARARAQEVFRRDLEGFAAAGYAPRGRPRELHATVERPDHTPLRLELVPTGGRVFGGAYALEVATLEPSLPATRGIRVRGRGVVRLERVSFRARGEDERGRRVASALEEDRRLQDALREVHFEEIRVDPDGRAVIRHMGGSVVWLLFPPMARPIPISQEQIRATIAGLEAFVRAGGRVGGS